MPLLLHLPTVAILSEGHSWALGGYGYTRAHAVGKAPQASDPHHLGGNTRTPPPLPVHGLPPDVESAIGAPHLPFGEAPRVHTDTAEDVLGKERGRLGLERPKLGLL